MIQDELRQFLSSLKTGADWSFEPGYYHAAPTTERARIKQHGLQPAQPLLNPKYPEGLRDIYPQAVYVTQEPEHAFNFGLQAQKVTKEPFDLWHIPHSQVDHSVIQRDPDSMDITQWHRKYPRQRRELEQEGYEGVGEHGESYAWAIPHPVNPSLYMPYENMVDWQRVKDRERDRTAAAQDISPSDTPNTLHTPHTSPPTHARNDTASTFTLNASGKVSPNPLGVNNALEPNVKDPSASWAQLAVDRTVTSDVTLGECPQCGESVGSDDGPKCEVCGADVTHLASEWDMSSAYKSSVLKGIPYVVRHKRAHREIGQSFHEAVSINPSSPLEWKPGNWGRGLYNLQSGQLFHWPEERGEHDDYRAALGWLDHPVAPLAIGPQGETFISEDGWEDQNDDLMKRIRRIDARLRPWGRHSKESQGSPELGPANDHSLIPQGRGANPNNSYDTWDLGKDCGLCRGTGSSWIAGTYPRRFEVCPNCRGTGKIVPN
jgi:hypothetical protein